VDATVILTKEQVGGILAHAFFGTFSRVHPAKFTGHEYQLLEFEALQRTTWHTAANACIINYFTRLAKEIPKGNLIVHRQVLKNPLDWNSSTKKLRKCSISAQGSIEDSDAELHADFANEFIGGGVLNGGNVQEEILFLFKPECLATLLFCAKMEPNESIIITGAERFSSYSGYGHGFKFSGNYVDQSPRDETGTIQRQIVAFDAIVAIGSPITQFKKNNFLRDLHKAYSAFFIPQKVDLPVLATGNWGCGAFGGDKHLKFFQQILAASEAGRDVLYFTFKDVKLENALTEFYETLIQKDLTIGTLFSLYMENIENYDPLQESLSHFLLNLL